MRTRAMVDYAKAKTFTIPETPSVISSLYPLKEFIKSTPKVFSAFFVYLLFNDSTGKVGLQSLNVRMLSKQYISV